MVTDVVVDAIADSPAQHFTHKRLGEGRDQEQGVENEYQVVMVRKQIKAWRCSRQPILARERCDESKKLFFQHISPELSIGETSGEERERSMVFLIMWHVLVCFRNSGRDTGPALVNCVDVNAEKLPGIAVREGDGLRDWAFALFKSTLLLIAPAQFGKLNPSDTAASAFVRSCVEYFHKVVQWGGEGGVIEDVF